MKFLDNFSESFVILLSIKHILNFEYEQNLELVENGSRKDKGVCGGVPGRIYKLLSIAKIRMFREILRGFSEKRREEKNYDFSEN